VTEAEVVRAVDGEHREAVAEVDHAVAEEAGEAAVLAQRAARGSLSYVLSHDTDLLSHGLT